MIFNILTIFPKIIEEYFSSGVLGRALKQKKIVVKPIDIRAYAEDTHGTVDDTPYGGGAGMVMKVEPIYRALKDNKLYPKKRKKSKNSKKQAIILLSASGRRWDQSLARHYSSFSSLTFICGRYEGIDERVLSLVDEEISLGDFVMTGGELAALAMVDSVARLLPAVLGNSQSLVDESHNTPGQLEYPHYTKPEIVKFGNKKHSVPAVLLSGHHGEIAKWRKAMATQKLHDKKVLARDTSVKKSKSKKITGEKTKKIKR